MSPILLEITPYLKTGALLLAGGLVPILIFRILRNKVEIDSRDISEYVMDEVDPQSGLMVAGLNSEPSDKTSKNSD